jgi:GTP-binding protein YchF
MQMGILGLPLCGKTTLFNILTLGHAGMGISPSRKDVNRGIAEVPDPRLLALSEKLPDRRLIYSTVEYVDVAGVSKGEGRSEWFNTSVRMHLQNVDALAMVIRDFESDIVPHPEGSVDAVRDLTVLETELMLSDLVILEGRIKRLEKNPHALTVDDKHELELLHKCQESLENEQSLRKLSFSGDETKKLRGFQFLSEKPLLVVLNVGESGLADEEQTTAKIRESLGQVASDACAISGGIELEMGDLDPDDVAAFLEDLGVDQPARERILRTSYHLLGLQSFFTQNENEIRAWAVRQGATAPEAAGVVHTDMEKGFIRAEVVHVDDFLKCGSFAACRDAGVLRLEGRDYIVKDGDLVQFRFNV